MSKYLKILPIFGLLLFTGCSDKQSKISYNAHPTYKKTSYSKYNFDIVVPQAEYEFSNEKLASMIKELEGCPYVWAEEGPNRFDCSGYLYYMYGKMGINIPRVAREQIKQGVPVNMANLKFGDFIFFNTTKVRSDKITHVGIYLKDGWFSHASSSGGKTTYGNLFTNKYYNERFKGARRYAQENSYSAFEPKLSMYAIDMSNQANEVTTYANNNAKPTSPIVIASAPTAQRQVVKIEKIALATVAKPIVATLSIANAMAALDTPIDDTTTTNTQRLAQVPTTTQPTNEPLQAETTVQVTDSTEIAYKAEPTEVKIDIKTTELNEPLSTIKPTETKVAILPKPQTAPKIAINKTTAQPKIAKENSTQPKIAKETKNGYYVQLGKFQNKPNNELLKKITKNGFAYTLMPTNENGKSLSKLLIGPFKNKQDAGSTLREVQDNIEQTSFVTKVNS